MIKRIAIFGNSCTGKTTLSRKVSAQIGLPLYHVDGLQFDTNLEIIPYKETIEKLKEIQDRGEWIIDGYGPLDLIHSRMDSADLILFIDLPLWRIYFWFFKRQLQNIYSRRKELPGDKSELNYKHLIKGVKGIWKVHFRMRPEMVRLLSRANYAQKGVVIDSVSDLDRFRISDF